MPLLVCCSNEKDDDEAEAAIAFSNMDVQATRAIDLSTIYNNFIVKGFKVKPDNTKEVVMDGYTVMYALGKRWFYEGIGDQFLKYWDMSAASYTFAAVSPTPGTSTNNGYDATVAIDNNGKIKITNILGNASCDNSLESSGAPEWLIARTIRTKSAMTDRDDVDALKDDPDKCVKLHGNGTTHSIDQFYDDVPLNFHHIMAKVDFLAYSTSPLVLSSFIAEIPQDGVQQPIYNKADFNEGDAERWTNKTVEYDAASQYREWLFCSYTYQDGKTLGTDEKNPVLLASHVQIPQSWTKKGRKFEIVCEAVNGKKYTGTVTLDEDTNETNSWDENKHYRYVLKIDTGGEETQVILFAVDMDTWKWKEGNSFEEDEINW